MPYIYPHTELKVRYEELSKISRNEKTPIYITVAGYGDTVLVNRTLYERQIAELDLMRKLFESESDIAAGATFSAETVFKEIEDELKK